MLLQISDAILKVKKSIASSRSELGTSLHWSNGRGDGTFPHSSVGSLGLTKPNKALRPRKFYRDATPIKLNLWVESFKACYASGRLELASVGKQQAYFRACIKAPLVARISGRVTPDMPVLQATAKYPTSCLDTLLDKFLIL